MFSMLPYYFLHLPLPFPMILHLKASAVKKKKKKDSRSRLFLKRIFKADMCVSAPKHTMTDVRLRIFKLFQVFLKNVLYREKLFHV